MKIGYYAGTFYPFTNGHKHVVDEALKVFDRVIVGIHINSSKKLPHIVKNDSYVEAIQECFWNKDVIISVEPSRLVGAAALAYDADFLIRGLRNSTDYEYEENLAKINKELFNLSTVYFRAGEYGFVSSSMVKELQEYNYDYRKYVPESIYNFFEYE